MQTIVTHNGGFHSDDVFAVATLQLHLGKENVKITRTRDKAIIQSADWVVDVGDEYNPETKRFDHHQLGLESRENGIPYAAFGLVWKEVGASVAGSDEVAASIEERLVQPVDAGDNGISLSSKNEYNVAPFELYGVIGSYKPTWGSEVTDDEAFITAVDFARGLLERLIAHSQAGAAMNELAQAGYNAAEDKRILVFDEPVDRSSFIQFPDVELIVYPSETDDGLCVWRTAAIQTEYNTFDIRASFPAAWGGLRDDDLSGVSGIADAIFCHKNVFLFVAKSKEGAIAAAQMAK